MRIVLYLIAYIILLTSSSCNVHQWPEASKYAKLHLRLNYETEITEWKYLYNDDDIKELGLGKTYDNCQQHGTIQYIIRAYPLSGKQCAEEDFTQEFVFTKDIDNGYNHNFTFDIPPGEYNIMVWSDLVDTSTNTNFYNARKFSEITLKGTHVGNTNYRDAFRGTCNISLTTDYTEQSPDTLNITMQRPMAKFEFVTNDVAEFIKKEKYRYGPNGVSNGNNIKIEDYKVVFYYIGFMPYAYSIFTDKPVDSATGIMFETKLKGLDKSKASMGFDYVFVNGMVSTVTIQIGIYDKKGNQRSLTNPIKVSLMRSHHTTLTGNFLMQNASGGVDLNPNYDGDLNLVF